MNDGGFAQTVEPETRLLLHQPIQRGRLYGVTTSRLIYREAFVGLRHTEHSKEKPGGTLTSILGQYQSPLLRLSLIVPVARDTTPFWIIPWRALYGTLAQCDRPLPSSSFPGGNGLATPIKILQTSSCRPYSPCVTGQLVRCGLVTTHHRHEVRYKGTSAGFCRPYTRYS